MEVYAFVLFLGLGCWGGRRRFVCMVLMDVRTDKKQHFSEKVAKVESILAADKP